MTTTSSAPLFPAGPVVVGHRGMGRGEVAGYGENTAESFLAAADAGARWLEVDVRRTRDDELVVHHDAAFLDGTFLADLDGDAVVGRGVLRLVDLLDRLPAGVGVDFDLKSCAEDALRPPDRTTAALLAPVARRAHETRPVLVTSFDPAALAVLVDLAPEVPRGLLTWFNFPTEHALAAAAHLDVSVLALQVGSLSPTRGGVPLPHRSLARVLEVAHSTGLELMVWCPQLSELPWLRDHEVDAVCVDDVPGALRLLDARVSAVRGGVSAR